MHYQKISAFEQDGNSLLYILPACNIFGNFLSELSKHSVKPCIKKKKKKDKISHKVLLYPLPLNKRKKGNVF